MGSNSVEEGLMLQIDNPSHIDHGRIAVPAGIVIAAIVYFGVGGLFPVLGILPKVVLAVLAGGAVGVFLYGKLDRMKLDREALRREKARETRQAEADKLLSQQTGNSQ